MSSELSRKELKRPDVILVNLREGYHWVENNLKTLVWIAAVIFGAMVIWTVTNLYQEGSFCLLWGGEKC